MLSGSYLYWRIRMFVGIYMGYVFYTLSRQSLAYIVPLLKNEGFAGHTIGLISTSWAIVYGISKFVNGVLGDKVNPRYFMSIGLFAISVVSFFFAAASKIESFVIFWSLGAWFQGFGWPSCAKVLSDWYPYNQKGRWWGFWNTSLGFAGVLAPLIFSFSANSYGWRFVMNLTGIISMFGSVFVLFVMADSPQSLGFKSENMSKIKAENVNWKEWISVSLFSVFFDWKMWLLAISSLFSHLVNSIFHYWVILYAMQQKGYSYVDSSFLLFSFELGCMLGGLTCGIVSDFIFKGSRTKTNVLFTFMSFFCFVLMYMVIGLKYYWTDVIISFFCGLFVFGFKFLVGVTSVEVCKLNAAGTATGFIGLFSYLGSSLAGFPFGFIVDSGNWYMFCWVLIACSFLSFILLLPFWNFSGSRR